MSANYKSARDEGITVAIEHVTPFRAARWLADAAGRQQRPISRQRVAEYAEALEDGDFVFVGDPIRLDSNGQLMDGQHRLSAVVKSGIAIDMVVVRGVPADRYDVIDSGKSRRMADVLSGDGHSATHRLGGLLAAVYWHDTGGKRFANNAESRRARRNPVLLAEATTAQPIADRVYKALDGLPSLAYFGLAVVLFRRVATAADVDRFVSGVADDSGLDRGDPRKAAREWLIRESSASRAHTELNRTEMLAVLIAAWNAFRRGKQVIRFQSENLREQFAAKTLVPE